MTDDTPPVLYISADTSDLTTRYKATPRMHMAAKAWYPEETVEALRKERDRFEAALGRACLVGGTTYLVERAEKAEAERADEWRRRRDADASRDAAKAACETMRAERDAALARVEKLRHQITEASDPDFILGAMDNVNDMDVTLDGFAQAASRAIRAALSHNGRKG